MSLQSGARLGPYEIVSLLGAGGMGEVYRARDAKLNRDVALKILPDAFAADPARLARFQREAQVLASLNHPNIGHIYGLEDSGSTHALVLELVDGQTLADLILLSSPPSSSGARGAGLPLEEALAIAMQIADALEAAHEQGVVHRDLKPANITVRPDGVVKVLDFGLAKALDPGSSSAAEAINSPTLTSPAALTRHGVILGTAAYMSPEQTRGKVVDKRTDIWAFGCVLYEMLTGRVAFKGDTVSDTIVAILSGEPAWDALPSALPAGVRLLLERCLEKDPKRRLRDIGDARIEIDQLAGRSGGSASLRRERESPHGVAGGTARREDRTYRSMLSIILAVLPLAIGAAYFYLRTPSLPIPSPSQYTQITDFTDSATAPSLSPDGRMVTFIRGGEHFLSRGQIYVKLLPNGESVRLTSGADAKFGPVFTPDGSRIAYTSVPPSGGSPSWDTWTVPVLGGEPTRLLPNASGLVWLNDQHVMFSEIRGTGLHMGIVTATESRAEQRDIYFPAHERAMAHYSYASPDRRSVLVVEMDRTGGFNEPCRLVPFDGSTAGRRDVGPAGACTSAAWSPDGKWMYFRVRLGSSSHLWRQRFPDGAPEQITFGPTEEEGLAMAPDGRSLVTSIGTRRSAIWLHDATGEHAISSEGYAFAPRLSSNGTRVFYLLRPDSTSSSTELRSIDLASGKTDSVLPGLAVTDFDISRDEKEVAFTTASSGGETEIWLASIDRSAPPRLVTRGGDKVSFGAHGELVFRSLEKQANVLTRIKTDGSERERITTALVLNKYDVSPDGEWAIVFSPGTGKDAAPETVAIPVHGGAPRKIGGPNDAGVWSSNGRLFYLTIEEQTLAIPVPPGKSLPELPDSGIRSIAEGRKLPGAQVLEHGPVSPGPDGSTYVFVKTDVQRNLFRIQLR